MKKNHVAVKCDCGFENEVRVGKREVCLCGASVEVPLCAKCGVIVEARDDKCWNCGITI